MFQNLPGTVGADFKDIRPSPSRLSVIKFDEDGMTVSFSPQKLPLVTPKYANKSNLASVAKWRSVGRQTKARIMKQSQPSGSSPTVGCCAQASKDDKYNDGFRRTSGHEWRNGGKLPNDEFG